VGLQQLLASDFGSRMLGALRAHDLDPSGFVIELTESAWTVDSADTLAALADLRAAGTSLAIDDFGAGFSSLSRLHELEVDAVKLDRVLLTGIPGDTRAAMALRAIIDLARVCEAVLVAEGVETEEQLAWLVAQRIELAQGFLFGDPQRAGEIVPLLARSLAANGVGR
jgi:EAL domain-containing protein (putative c-di-GMP-specific phosphodiesterase class I)